MTVKIFALALLLPLSIPAHAAETARAHLDAFAKGLHALSASFEQQVFDANGGKGKSSRGTLALDAPRQFRWETTAPYAQLIVADGDKVWIYDADLEQVSVRPQGTEEAHSPLTVLTDLSRLDRDFATSEQGEHDGLTWLRLKSREKDPQFAYADLGFDAGGLERMRFEDTLGDKTEIRFADWKRNPALPPDTFRFTPPPGVDVIGDPTPAAVAHPVHD
jgi:outer membrane lipoprotein carrier protein